MQIFKSYLLLIPTFLLSANMAMAVIPCDEPIKDIEAAKRCVTAHVIGQANNVSAFLYAKNMLVSDHFMGECTAMHYTPENKNISVFKESTFAGHIDSATLQGNCVERGGTAKGSYFQCYLQGPEGCYFNRDGSPGVLTTRASILIGKDTGAIYSIAPVR